jgi:hypothetical protein
MKIEVSIGEIVDKLSILKLKTIHIKDPEKLVNIQKEYEYLYDVVFNELNINQEDFDELVYINNMLWTTEDKIRVKERDEEFDEEFIYLARHVYITNDHRARFKKDINIKYGSDFVEEKSYEEYEY